MQRKILVVDVDRCTGCRICELACSWVHEGVFNPLKSRISVTAWRREGIDVPMVCQQCDTPLCQDVCPTAALSRDAERPGLLWWTKTGPSAVGCASWPALSEAFPFIP